MTPTKPRGYNRRLPNDHSRPISMNIRDFLTSKVQQAMLASGVPFQHQPLVAPSRKAGFGDYQANGAMGAAKAMGTNPRELAQKILEQLELQGIAEKLEVAGPGCSNSHLDNAWLGEQFAQAQQDQRLDIAPLAQPDTLVEIGRAHV